MTTTKANQVGMVHAVASRRIAHTIPAQVTTATTEPKIAASCLLVIAEPYPIRGFSSI